MSAPFHPAPALAWMLNTDQTSLARAASLGPWRQAPTVADKGGEGRHNAKKTMGKKTMASLKVRIEQGFIDFTRKIIAWRWAVIALMVVLAVAAASRLPLLTIDMSDEGFLHPEDPILLDYTEFRDQFGRDDLIVLTVKGDAVFSQPFLARLKAMHVALEDTVPHLNEITSMVNARNTRGVEGGIIVEDLLENWPADDEAMARLKERVMSNPLYANRLISEDGAYTTVILQTDVHGGTVSDDDALAGFDEGGVAEGDQAPPPSLSDAQRDAIVLAVTEVAARFQAADFQIHIAGSPVVTQAVKTTMRADMMLFMRLALAVIAVALLLMFRRLSAVVYPLLVVVLSLISTLALMALFGVAIKMPTMILPSFLLAVGVGDSVHVLAIFFQNLQKHDKQEALARAMGHSGLAIVMTSLTTAAGLASFSWAEIAPVADLGVFASVGVMLALLYTIVFLPALLAVTPLRGQGPARQAEKGAMMALMDFCTAVATGRYKQVLVVSALLLLLSIIGLSRLSFSHNILSWLPETMPVRQATEVTDAHLKGSVTLELVVDTGVENGLYDPLVLGKMQQLATLLEEPGGYAMPVGKVMSVVDVIKEIHQALHENRPEFYVIPDDAKLIPQEFLLFENSGSDDLEDVVDSRFQLARITIKMPWQDAMKYVPFISEVEERAQAIFGPGITMTTTGVMALFGRIIYAAIHSAAISYLIAFGVITVMMIFLVGSVRLGILCMVPNLAPIGAILGLMGWLGIPMDMFTMLIGSIAIGMAVDDTIHFVYNYRKYYALCGNNEEAVRQTLHTTGRAMLTTTVVLSLGFFIFMFAAMSNLFYFGLLTGLALLLALAADFLLAPALLTLASGSAVGRSEILNR